MSQECIKCWCDDPPGEAKGTWSPTLDPGSSRTLLREGGAQLGSQSAVREGGPVPAAATTTGAGALGDSMQSWAGGNWKREPSARSPKRMGLGVSLRPCEGTRGGDGGEALGVSENGAAPPALVLADLEASPSGHLEHLPHPLLGLG